MLLKARLVRPLVLAAPVLGLILTGCGGGSNDSPSTAPSTQQGEGRSQAQSVLPNLLTQTSLKDSGWIAFPPALIPSDTYTASAHSGATYYVDAKDGNNGANGSTPTTAWKTLAHATQRAEVSGSALLLKCGSTWHEEVSITGNAAPSLIGAYGDQCSANNRPTIKGTDILNLTGWAKSTPTDNSNWTYSAAYSGVAKRLFLDGTPLLKARYPNFERIGQEFAYAKKVGTGTGSPNSFFVSNPGFFDASRPLVGATVYIRTAAWMVESATVTAHDQPSGLVTVSWNGTTEHPHDPTLTINDGTGYIFEGMPWMLDTPGEWLANNGTLKVWMPDNSSPDLAGNRLEVGIRDKGIFAGYTAASKNLRIERIRLEGQDLNGIVMDKTPGAVVSDVQVLHAGEVGIRVFGDEPSVGAENIRIEKSYVEGAGWIGIYGYLASGLKVLNNWVVDTALNKQGRTHSVSAGIRVGAPGVEVQYNTIQRSSNAGIIFRSDYNDNLIANNSVISACARMTDCGGIYSGVSKNTPAPSPGSTGISASVSANMVVGIKNNTEGLPGTQGQGMGDGIYLDFKSSRVQVLNNIISDVSVGIALHNATSNTMSGNVVRHASHASFSGDWTTSQEGNLLGNTLSGNSFVSHVPLQKNADTGAIEEGQIAYAENWGHYSDIGQIFFQANANKSINNETLILTPEFGSAARVKPNGEITYRTGGGLWQVRAGNAKLDMRFADWATYMPSDSLSQPLVFRPYKVETQSAELLQNNWQFYGQTPENTNYAFGSFSPLNSIECDPGSSVIRLCGRLINGHPYDSVRNSSANLNLQPSQGNSYLLSYAVKAPSTSAAKAKVAMRRASGSLANLGVNLPDMPLAPNQTVLIEQYFNAKDASNDISADALLDIRSSDLGKPLLVLGAWLKKATVDPLPAWKDIALHVLNLSDTDRIVRCTEDAGIAASDCASVRYASRYESNGVVHQPNELVSWPLTVQKRTAPFLVVGGAAWRQ